MEYLKKLAIVSSADDQLAASELTSLPKMPPGRPLLLGSELDKTIQDYLKALRAAGGVINTAIVMAAAEGILNVDVLADFRNRAVIYSLSKIGLSCL